MVCDSHTAEDVAQNTFIALAKNVRQVRDRSVLSSWLHSTARNLAANTIRSEVRRRVREQEVAAMNELLANEPDAAWKNIAPHLDDAIAELSDSDRDALLLRYFERKSAREMGQIFGTSEDAAKKRVSRAVERLREFFSKRGVTIGAGGLVVVISANAVQAAPVALATTISTAAISAGTTIGASTTVAATKAIVMTTLQKALVMSVLTAAIGTGIYEAHRALQLQNQAQTLQQQQAPLAEQIRQLQGERDSLKSGAESLEAEIARLNSHSNETELLKLRGEVAQLRQASAESKPDDSRAAMVKSWLEREDKLKQLVQQHPDKTIPELQLLSEQQWLNAAMNAKFDQDKDIRQTLADLRHTAENNFVSLTKPALDKYMKANGGQFPTDLSQLQPYFESPMDESILSRWGIVPQSAFPNQSMGGDWLITEKTPIDPDLDNHWAIGPGGYGTTSYQSPEITAAIATIDPAMKAYAAANNGEQPTDPAQILPYLTTPQQQAAYQTLSKKFPTGKQSGLDVRSQSRP